MAGEIVVEGGVTLRKLVTQRGTVLVPDIWLTPVDAVEGDVPTFQSGAWIAAPGAVGEDGLSAYEVAVANGYQGTEQQWLISLEGADGATGPEGPIGPQGPQGSVGNQGIPGDQGIQGIQGIQGVQGVPGENGSPGAPGSVWFSGTGSPSAGTGIVGDWYLDDANGDVYEKTGASSWTLRDNLTGPAGGGGLTQPQIFARTSVGF
jgi:hypothetical protein